MKHNFFYSILLMAAFLTISLSATAQQRSIVQGICTNEKGKTVENVSVYVNESQLIAITDENGCFTYTMPRLETSCALPTWPSSLNSTPSKTKT